MMQSPSQKNCIPYSSQFPTRLPCTRWDAYDEYLNVNEFATIDQVRMLLEGWPDDGMTNNHRRPHSSLSNLAPCEFGSKDQITDAGMPFKMV